MSETWGNGYDLKDGYAICYMCQLYILRIDFFGLRCFFVYRNTLFMYVYIYVCSPNYGFSTVSILYSVLLMNITTQQTVCMYIIKISTNAVNIISSQLDSINLL